MIYTPDNEKLHYHAVKWFLRGKKYDPAVKSVRYLNDNHPTWIKTIYVNTKFAVHFSDESVRSTLKDKQLEPIDELIKQILDGSTPKEYLEKNTRDKHPDSIKHQRYYVRGLVTLFKENAAKEHVQNVFNTLDKAISQPEFKKHVLKDLRHMVRILDFVPEETRDQLIEVADQVFWKFKETQLASINE